jgi:hypothetical protein
LSAKQQADLHGERFDRDAEAARRRADSALADAGDETARVRRLQAELGIRVFESYPEVGPLLQIQKTLRSHLERLVDEAGLIDIERFLTFNSTKRGPRIDDQRAMRDRLKAKLRKPEPEAPKPGDLPPSILAALQVFGPDKPKDTKPELRLADLQEKQVVVEAGLRDVHALIEDLRATAAYETARALQKRHQALCVDVFRAAQKLSEAAFAESSLREAFVAAGFRARSDLLPSAVAELPSTLLLGSESQWSSQISQFRRLLTSRGLL